MKTSNNLYFGSNNLTSLARRYLLDETRIIYNLFKKKIFKNRAKEISSMIASITSTATAIALLGIDERFYNECVMLTRGFFERIVNICYLLVCKKTEYNKFSSHTRQKSHRKLEQEFKAGKLKIGLQFTGKDTIEKHTNILKDIKSFSTKSGSEKKRWPDLSIPDRLKIISKKSKINIGLFLLFQLTYYTDASEALHGTFYGATFHSLAYQPNLNTQDKVEYKKEIQKNFTLLFLNIAGLLVELIVLLGSNHNFNNTVMKAQQIEKKFLKVFKNSLNKTE